MVLYFHPKGLYFHPTWISLGAVKGALEGLKVNWIMPLPCLQLSSGFPLPFKHNPAPFQAGLALSQLFTPHPLPVLTWSTLLHSAPTAPAILRFLKCGRFVLVIGPFLLVVSFFQIAFSPHLCVIGFSHMGLREPLHDQLSRRARPLPAPQPLLIPLTSFFFKSL